MKKVNFTAVKGLYFLEDVDIGKVLVSNNIFSSEKDYKYSISYLYDDNKIKPLHIMLPKTSVYVKRYDNQTKCMYFLTEDNDLLEKYKTMWDKVSADIKKEFDSKPFCNKKFLKTKIKSYGDEDTDFHYKEIPKVDSNRTCLAIISLDSALNKDGKYYP